MTRIIVTNQAELAAALTNPDHACATHEIIIPADMAHLVTIRDLDEMEPPC